MEVKINIEKLNEIVSRELPDQFEKAVSKQEAKSQQFSALAMPTPGQIVGGVATFCNVWPMAKETANTLLSMLGWLMPEGAAKLRTVIKAIDEGIVPVVCKK